MAQLLNETLALLVLLDEREEEPAAQQRSNVAGAVQRGTGDRDQLGEQGTETNWGDRGQRPAGLTGDRDQLGEQGTETN